jgi:hypothetical protein
MKILLVIILTMGHPSSWYYVDYDTPAQCATGLEQAHKISVEPHSQKVEAFCLTPAEWKKLQDLKVIPADEPRG